jgi:hypothetical protein
MDYGQDSLESQEMAASSGGNALRDEFYRSGCQNVVNLRYRTGKALWQTFLSPFGDWSNTGLQVGGFTGASAIREWNMIVFTIPNTAGTKSFFYRAVPDRKGTTGPMHNILQTFIWTEKIDLCRCINKN